MTTSRSLAGIALAILTTSSALAAQQARRAAAPPAPPRKPTIIVLPSVESGPDSMRTIVERDLDYSDVLSPVRGVTARPVAAGAVPNLAALAAYKPRWVLATRREGSRVHAALYDATRGQLFRESTFQIAVARPFRHRIARDSLVRLYDQRDAAGRVTLAAIQRSRDSLEAAPAGRDRGRRAQTAAAVRDSMRTALLASEALVRAQIERDNAGRAESIRLALEQESLLADSTFYAERMAIHAVSDAVQQWITGRAGMAQSRIAYVQDGTLRVVDADGANDRPVTVGGRVLSPAWHPTGQSLVFSDLADGGTQIGEVNVFTKRARLLEATSRGLNLTPVYTPDGKSVIYAHGTEATTDLVIASLAGGKARPLSRRSREASSPVFSPDGRRIAYIASRAWQGKGPSARMTPQIFTMNADGSGDAQLTPSVFGVRSYRTSPDWSPDGERVAYMQQNRDFQVWTIGVRDKRMRRLTASAENEDPTWAPDSRHMAIASTRAGSKTIWILDVETGRTRQLTRLNGARLPAWSPRLKFAEPVASALSSGGSN